MLRNNHRKTWLPKHFLWRLTIINIVVISSFTVLSSWAIYNAACFLAEGLGGMNNQGENLFDSTLFQYLWIFSISTITIGSMIHFYLTKEMVRPLSQLIESTKRMKQGEYPHPIKVKAADDMGELIGHFNELVHQLKNKQEHRQKFLSDLSHEFRTPLSNLSGYLSALSNGVIEGDPKLYQSLHKESKRLINMIEQLEELKVWDDVSKKTLYEKVPTDMKLLIEQSVRMFSWSLKKAGITAKVQVEFGQVSIDGGGISQVISNLIDNAILYYKGTGPILVKGEVLDTSYRFTVTGPGQPISKPDQERIFERFYRIDPSRSRDTGGTGLGLAISKEIVEHHNGKIGVTSKDNQHTFWFTLPF